MASNYFTISPTTGNGNTIVDVTPKSTNTGTTDRLTTVTLSNGAASVTVSLRQRYKPYFEQFGSTTFPASGGSILFTVHTEYPVAFRSIPDWITVSAGGTTYREGQQIPASTADGTTFTLTAPANPSTSSRSFGATFNMGHYVNNVLQSSVQYFTGSQAGSSGEITATPSSLVFDWNDTNAQTLNVTSNGNWTSQLNDN